MAGFGAQRREARLNANYDGVELLSDRMYNLLMGGVVLYGLALSFLLCVLLRPYMDALVQHYDFIMIVYFILVFVGIMMSGFSSNPVVSFIGYNMVVVPVGVIVSMAVSMVMDYSSEIVTQALVYTMIVTCCMIALSMVNVEFFLGLGGLLFSVLTGLVLSGFVCWIFGWSTYWQSWIAVVLFSLYIGYDFQRAQMFEKTMDNAIDCALDIYLDIINLFIQILRILASSKGSRRRR